METLRDVQSPALSVPQAAAQLGVGPSSLQRMIRDAEVAAQAGLSHAEVMQRMRNLRASARLANGAARPLVTPDTV